MRGGVRYLCHKSLDNIAQKVQEQALIKNHEEIESFVQALFKLCSSFYRAVRATC